MTDESDFTMDLPESADEPALRRVQTVAKLLDEAVRVPGTNFRIGLDPILSITPSPVGDAAGAVISLYIVAEAANLGVPYTTIVRMLVNVGVDAAIGSIPVVGALFDAGWKANKRNVDLIERHVDAARQESGEEGEPVPVEIETSD